MSAPEVKGSEKNGNSSSRNKSRTRISFLHLDLGIGGAERLVVDAATQLRERGFSVGVYTTHHDTDHCFNETLQCGNNGLGDVIEVYGDWLPRYVDIGFLTGKASDRRFVAFCGILRMIYLSLIFIAKHVFSISSTDDCDAHVVFLDGLSAPIPLLAMFGFPVLFYCHFPDRYLSPINTDESEKASKSVFSQLKRGYRDLVDLMEDVSMAQASLIAVNSKFTADVCTECFSFLNSENTAKKLVIIYPAVNCDANASTDSDKDTINSSDGKGSADTVSMNYCDGFDSIFVSLNRFEKKKRLEIAIHAFYRVLNSQESSSSSRRGRSDSNILLVIAGGYDSAVEENQIYYQELLDLVNSLELSDKIIFRRSISNEERLALLKRATALLYTPDREHFGIVPIEAMAAGTAVVAVASGGPLETVVDGKTGFLVPQTEQDFALAMDKLLLPDKSNRSEQCAAVMGRSGRARVVEFFSKSAMGEKLENSVWKVAAYTPSFVFITVWIVVLIMVGQGIGYSLKFLLRYSGAELF